MTPIDMESLVSHPKWPQAKEFYAQGYHDAKDQLHRNTYPPGSLRWHAYQRGWNIANDWFNDGNTRQPADG